MRFLGLIILASALAACTSQPDGATADSDYGAWDTDADEFIDNDEFRNAFTNSPYYAQWNTDGDPMIDPDEFAQGFFRTIDDNNDGTLSTQEWQSGREAYFSDATLEDFQALEAWDADGNQEVQPEEFVRVLAETDYLGEWDENGDDMLDEEEIADGVFTMWDTDANGVIEAEEYKAWDEKRVLK